VELTAQVTKAERIFLSPPCIGGSERLYVEEAFKSNYIAPLGPMVDGLERAICEYTGAGHCAVLSSGTGALHLALAILGVGAGDEVLCPSFTFVASANPIVYVGATPVFVDSETETWNMCPVLLEKAIKDRIDATGSKPKAIVLVHLYGMPARIDEVMAVAQQYGIPVIEDAAEALGSRYASPCDRLGLSASSNSKAAGTFGCMGAYSFNGNKIITTSGGGALVSDDAEYMEKARFLATQARDPAPHYEHSQIGYNYRMSNIVAAIGLGQMEALPGFVERCREINAAYREILGAFPGIAFQGEPCGRYRSNFWLTAIVVEPDAFGVDREAIRLALESNNIESRPLWKPLHMQPVYRDMQAPMYGGAVCERIFGNGLCLPSGPAMTDGDIKRIVRVIMECRD